MLYNYIMVKLSPKDRKILSQIDKNTKWKEVKEVQPVNDAIKDLDIYEERIQLMCSEYLKDSAKSGDYDDKEMFDKCREAEKVKRRVDKKAGKAQKQGKGRGVSDTKLTEKNKEKETDEKEITKLVKQLGDGLGGLVKEFKGEGISDYATFAMTALTKFGDVFCAIGLTKSLPILLQTGYKNINNFSIKDIGFGEDTGLISTKTYDALLEFGKYCGVSIVSRLMPFLKDLGIMVSNNIVRTGKSFINKLTGSDIDLDDGGDDGGDGGSGGQAPQQQAQPQTEQEIRTRAENIATAKAQREAQTTKLEAERAKSAKSVLEKQTQKGEIKPQTQPPKTEPPIQSQQAPTPPTIQKFLDTGRGTGKVKQKEDIADEVLGTGYYDLGVKTARHLGSIAGDTLIGGMATLGSFQLAKKLFGTGADIPQQQQQDTTQPQQQDLNDRLNRQKQEHENHLKRQKEKEQNEMKQQKEMERQLDEMDKSARGKGLGFLGGIGGGVGKMATLAGIALSQPQSTKIETTRDLNELSPYLTGNLSPSESLDIESQNLGSVVGVPINPQTAQDMVLSDIDFTERNLRLSKQRGGGVESSSLQNPNGARRRKIKIGDIVQDPNQKSMELYMPTIEEKQQEVKDIVEEVLTGGTEAEQNEILNEIIELQAPTEEVIQEAISIILNTKPIAI